MYYNECPFCGCNLDPGERCKCRDEKEIKMRKQLSANMRMNELLEVEEWNQEELKICC